MILQFTNIHYVASSIYTNLQLQNEFNLNTILEWISEVANLTNSVVCNQDDYYKGVVKNFKVRMPCVIFDITLIRYNNTIMTLSNAVNANVHNKDKEYLARARLNTYSIDPPYIKCSLRDNSEIHIYYKKPRLDDDGYLLVPDMIEFNRAALYYVLARLKMIQYKNGKVSLNEWKEMENISNYRLDQARTAMAMLTPEQFNALANQETRLIPGIKDRENMFIKYSDPQVFKNWY